MLTAGCDSYSGRRPRFGLPRSRCELGPDVVDLARERVEVAAVVDHDGWRTARRSSSVAWAAIRRSASSRAHAPDLEAVEPHVERRLDHDHRARTGVLGAVLLSTSSGTSQTTIASAGASSILPLELLADRRPGDVVERLAAVLVGEGDRGEGGPVEATVGVRGSRRRSARPGRPAPAAPARRPPAPPRRRRRRPRPCARRSSATVDLPDADPPGEPHQQHCDGCYMGQDSRCSVLKLRTERADRVLPADTPPVSRPSGAEHKKGPVP